MTYTRMSARLAEAVWAASGTPAWDAAVAASLWRRTGHAARLRHREPHKGCVDALQRRNAWFLKPTRWADQGASQGGRSARMRSIGGAQAMMGPRFAFARMCGNGLCTERSHLRTRICPHDAMRCVARRRKTTRMLRRRIADKQKNWCTRPAIESRARDDCSEAAAGALVGAAACGTPHTHGL